MRLIDADALECDTEWSEYHDGFTAYSQMAIDTAPSIDIVRCKECKYWHDHITTFWCSRGAELRPQESGWIKRNADDYCSYGQKGDENVETD